MIRSRKRQQQGGGLPTELRYPVVPFGLCPAKTFSNSQGVIKKGHDVLTHCRIVGEVAKAIIGQFPAPLQVALFPEGSALIAAAHDIGKVSPYFVEKLRRVSSDWQESLPEQKIKGEPSLEYQWGGHAGVSQLAVQAMGVVDWVPEILGQHHGSSPPIATCHIMDERFGGQPWQQQRIELVETLQQQLAVGWPKPSLGPCSSAIVKVLSGLTSVADWIGSGEFFENPETPWEGSIKKALSSAGFVATHYTPNLTFKQVFGFEPRQAQQQLIDQVCSPGVYVLEAPMGLGKTEAALYAAYQMLQQGQARGIYFALPTQLTSNKLHERFSTFLDKILYHDDSSAVPSKGCAMLLHGKAWLQETQMGEEGSPGRAWFSKPKRGLLAPFAVGTLDQALMSVIRVKHGFVRSFGLAGKVVILDEVHSYDAYTGALLDKLIAQLRELHCTVIILSATLSHQRREALLSVTLKEKKAYPLITAVSLARACSSHHSVDQQPPAIEVAVPVISSHVVQTRLIHDLQLAVEEVLDRAAQGQQILWIENTVQEAQQCYLNLAADAANIGIECGLLHSRFTAIDRENIEQKWVNLFGKPGWQQRQSKGRILIGTQVLEQSLDIDADFLVSRFAPSDMLLQRLGRLWRHTQTPRHPRATCDCWLIAPELAAAIENPESKFGHSAYVYSPYVLCRSLQVWGGLSSVIEKPALITLPKDIRSIIEETYCDQIETGKMKQWLDDLVLSRKKLQGLSNIALATTGNVSLDETAQTRYSEISTLEVLLCCSIISDTQKKVTQVTLLTGEVLELPHQKYRFTKKQWRKLSATLMSNFISVPEHHAPPSVNRKTLESYGFGHVFYLGNPERVEAELRVATVSSTGVVQSLQFLSGEQPVIKYRDDIGYQFKK